MNLRIIKFRIIHSISFCREYFAVFDVKILILVYISVLIILTSNKMPEYSKLEANANATFYTRGKTVVILEVDCCSFILRIGFFMNRFCAL